MTSLLRSFALREYGIPIVAVAAAALLRVALEPLWGSRLPFFTFYPAVQRGDIPKIEITREGAIWYNPRSALKGAIGVLYPDMSKMTSFEARY